MHRMFGLMAAAALATAGCGGSEYRKDAAASPAAGAMGTSHASPGAYASPATTGITGATSGEFAAEIVSVDTAARTVTVKESAVGGTATTGSTGVGGATTIRVDGTAGDMLRDFKTGDRVVVSCAMGAGGTTGTLSGCTSVTAIRKAG